MAKHNIDDILSELGLPEEQGKGGRSLGAGKGFGKGSPARPTHRVDRAEQSFSPLPSMPAHQGDRARERAADDPAVKNKPLAAPRSSVGRAISEIYTPEQFEVADADAPELGEQLRLRGVVTGEQLAAARQVMKQSPGRTLCEILIEQGVDEVGVQQARAELAGLPFERIDLAAGLDGGVDGKSLQRLTGEFCKRHSVIPLRAEGSRVVIGATRTEDVFLVDEIKRMLGCAGVKLVVVTSADVRGALELVGQQSGEDVDLSEILADVEESDVEVTASSGDTHEVGDLQQQAGESPVIRYANYIIQTAVKEGASDIHIEPGEKKLKVRFRIDGVLFEMMNPPVAMAPALTSRLKIMAGLDISERRVPQDGRIRCTVQGRKLDLRVSTIPTPVGEKTVMRILDTRSINVELEQLGFDEATLEIWKGQIRQPHGIVLVTGPTGSGKTTTLYASLRTLDKNKLNISTVEDPVEYHLDGITQTQTHAKIGMTFARALKALLRQDPDVIMLGEIRDEETAHTAVQAALTGHLVLSTLHTNDAPSSITRLVNIGLEPFLVGAAVNSVLAQRLVRKLCAHCKAHAEPSEEMTEYLAMQGMNARDMWSAVGCDKCRNTGYAGRVGIYELLAVDDQLRDVIARNPNVSEFRRMCLERGMVSLQSDGMRKVADGLTSIQEVMRVTREGH